ncbi:NlpC/P60 family peptidoglycan-binding protein RipD [Mycolicibacterium diernhoferi]
MTLAMRRFCALVLGLALLLVSPGVASAEPFNTRPVRNQQAVDYVIKRALSQRGVPFAYGGGDANGPTRGVVRETPVEVDPAAAAIPGGVPGLNFPGLAPPAPVAAPLIPSAATVPDPAANVVGFDASGIVVYAFAGVGVKLPRSSGEMYKVGQKVLPEQALPGDLIFYGPEGTQSVALFIGNAQMVEATDSGVAVSPVRTASMTPYLVRIIA